MGFVEKFIKGSIMGIFIYYFNINLGLGLSGYYLMYMIFFLLFTIKISISSFLFDDNESIADLKKQIKSFENKELVKSIFDIISIFVIFISLITSISFLSGVLWINLLTMYFGIH